METADYQKTPHYIQKLVYGLRKLGDLSPVCSMFLNESQARADVMCAVFVEAL